MAFINDFLSLIYPRYCEACEENLLGHEHFLCNSCLLSLPKSNFHLQNNSELEKVFAGRVLFDKVLSLYLYQKCGRVQKLLHAIKYQNQKELAEFVGKLYAADLQTKGTLNDVDAIVPIPLHKNKLRSRGYNQSEWFAKGLASGLQKPVLNDLITRTTETATQTKKKKYQRWENVEGIFSLMEPENANHKHILLVDDVITTGATIEAACLTLKEIEGIRISIASIAFAARM